jgi:hypothetical protein
VGRGDRLRRRADTATRGPCNVRINDVKRLVKAIQDSGLHIRKVVIEGPRVEIIPGEGPATPFEDDEEVVI